VAPEHIAENVTRIMNKPGREVFDRFRTHTIGSRHKGVGLGLSIVRAFVELHGGEVQIQSAPGEGTTVTCIFPEAGIVRNQSAEVA
jgi:signal transduction histidine kinase